MYKVKPYRCSDTVAKQAFALYLTSFLSIARLEDIPWATAQIYKSKKKLKNCIFVYYKFENKATWPTNIYYNYKSLNIVLNKFQPVANIDVTFDLKFFTK